MENTKPTPQRLKDFVMNRGGHVFDTRTGRSYALNSTAQMALLLLQDDHSVPEVVAILARRSGQHESVVEAGMEAFVGQLGRYAQ